MKKQAERETSFFILNSQFGIRNSSSPQYRDHNHDHGHPRKPISHPHIRRHRRPRLELRV